MGLWCLKEEGASDGLTKATQVDAPIRDDEVWVRCIKCHSVLSSEEERTRINQATSHRCMNPHGHFFHVECFNDAVGAIVRGEAETFWSWFTGYAWQISECRGCGEHIGWYFSRGDAGFFGLITDRITSGS